MKPRRTALRRDRADVLIWDVAGVMFRSGNPALGESIVCRSPHCLAKLVIMTSGRRGKHDPRETE